MKKIGIMGAGSWGTALAILLSNNGHDVTVWSIDKNEVEMLSEKREHTSKLPGVVIPDHIVFTNDIQDGILEKDVVVLAAVTVYQKYSAFYETICEGRTDSC